jgi:hypothetical protein
MTSETIKNITLTFEAIVGVAFSVFMMYSMWKTKKAAEKIVDVSKDLSDSIQQTVNNLPALISSFMPQLDPPHNQIILEQENSPININNPIPDLLVHCNDFLSKGSELNPLSREHILEIQDEANEFLETKTQSDKKIYYDREEKFFVALPVQEFMRRIANEMNRN